MSWLWSFFDFLWSSFLLLAPMLLLGLFLAGLIHVFISRQAILKWFRDDSLKSVSTSAAIGVPMPLCSCSVVPVVAEMHRKGASRSASMSFLITAPETGADSILVTNAFFGPVVAIVRPIISFLTAVVTGIFCIGLIRDARKDSNGDETQLDESPPNQINNDHEHPHDHSHDHAHGHTPLFEQDDDCYVSGSQLKYYLRQYLSRTSQAIGRVKYASWVKPEFYYSRQDDPSPNSQILEGSKESVEETSPKGPDLPTVLKHIFRYGFIEVADDILFALLVGIALGGVLFLVIPSDLMANEYARWLAYPVMVLIGVPLYICASASTPIAAALVAKGVSPGAALVFLMTGPATNTGTIAIIGSQFGARFTTVYVAGVILVTLVLGIAIDLLLIFVGLEISVNLGASDSATILVMQWGGAIGLLLLIIWRFRKGALKSGWDDLLMNVRPVWGSFARLLRRSTGSRGYIGWIAPNNPAGVSAWIFVIGFFAMTGFTSVPPGHVGYGLLFGEVKWRDLEPGLHYLAPWPLVKVDKWPVKEIKSLNADLDHEYVSGDLNLVKISLNLQYIVDDPYVYHYRTSNPTTVVTAFVESHTRSFISSRPLESLLNVHRERLENEVLEYFAHQVSSGVDPVLNSISPIKANLLAIGPTTETVSAFREVSSAQEDKERTIVNAQRFLVTLTPQAHGNAYFEVQQADGQATRRVLSAEAEANAIKAVASAQQTAPDVLQNMLWREKLETALAGKAKIIVPNQGSLEKVALWKRSTEPIKYSHKENK